MKKLTIKIQRTQIDEQPMFAFLNESDKILFCVSCKDKKIKGKDLYNSIYAKAELGEPINIEVDQSGLDADDRKHFGEYVKDLFDAINGAMNEQFNVDGPGEETDSSNGETD